MLTVYQLSLCRQFLWINGPLITLTRVLCALFTTNNALHLNSVQCPILRRLSSKPITRIALQSISHHMQPLMIVLSLCIWTTVWTAQLLSNQRFPILVLMSFWSSTISPVIPSTKCCTHSLLARINTMASSTLNTVHPALDVVVSLVVTLVSSTLRMTSSSR